MGIFDFLFKKEAVQAEEEEPPMSPEMKAKLEAFFKELSESTRTPCIRLRHKLGTPSVTDSKFGGKPYMPNGEEYPHDQAGNPLRLLAQLNFEKLPRLEGFPEKGMLQFFFNSMDDCFGMNLSGSLTEQNGFRVIYRAHIDASDCVDFELPPLAKDDYLPFSGEFQLLAESALESVSAQDFRSGEASAEAVKKHFGAEVKGVYDLDDEIYELYWERFSGSGHKIGGYPFFTQGDPREYDEYCSHTVLLLQIDSCGSGDEEIIWGDSGVANFFIKPEDLAALDFSNVMYTWDCY